MLTGEGKKPKHNYLDPYNLKYVRELQDEEAFVETTKYPYDFQPEYDKLRYKRQDEPAVPDVPDVPEAPDAPDTPAPPEDRPRPPPDYRPPGLIRPTHPPGRVVTQEEIMMPIIIITAVFGAILIFGPLLVRRGQNKGIVRACIMMTAVCMWIFWITVYIGQMNPLIGPRLENTTIAWMSYRVGTLIRNGTGGLEID